MMHPCNPSYLGGRGRRIEFKVNQDKVRETLSQKQNIGQVQWLTHIIPVTWEAKIESIPVQGQPEQKVL
jgi:hypothetical protein